MKKIFLLMAAAAMLFASCSKDSVEYTGSNEISLTSVAQNGVKGLVEGTTFPTTDDFMVFAYFCKDSIAGKTVGAGFSQPYINNQPFTHSKSGTTWWGGSKGSHTPYYWPKTGSLVFAGYHGTLGDATVTYAPCAAEESKTAPESQKMYINNFTANTVVAPAAPADSMQDLMYFPVTDISYNENGNGQAVNVAFHHALSWLTFKVGCNDAADSLFRVDKIELNNVKPQGSATITGSQAQDTCVWAATGTPATLVQFNDLDTISKGNAHIIGNEYTVIPQGATTLTINYSQKSPAGEWVSQDAKTIDLYTLKDTTDETVVANWEAAKHYIYTITFTVDTDDEILISPTVVKWKDVEVGYVIE